MIYLIDLDKITPVEFTEGIYIKRDDLFSPFGDVNGGKFRQCFYLVKKNIDNIKSLITACGIHSPQAPIVASIANHFGIPSTVLYGGTTERRLHILPMPLLARKYGAKIKNLKTGRHTFLYAKAREIAEQEGSFVIEYAFNCRDNIAEFFESTASQVQNIPDELDNLIITCGSGITPSGILLGIVKYKKKVKNIWIVGIAPNREKKIRERVIQLGEYSGLDNLKTIRFNYIHLQKEAKRVARCSTVGDIVLHRHYEAIAYRWMKAQAFKGKTLFWIIGKEAKW